ncbi:GNAT family N-acetyltransferase [Nonomuraea longicatena]|uniref:GNAT family N-acetyltransferase n=1 Tax=Nonomuraea longicatena TaxID=83682 RepID=A0ABP3Z5V0_9ACTN
MWSFTEDIAAFPEAAFEYMRRDPVRNTVPLTVMAGVRDGMPSAGAFFGWWSTGGRVGGVAFRTPPSPVGLALMPVEAVAELALALGERHIPSVMGRRDLARAFAEARKAPTDTVVEERLYRLGTLTPPQVPGRGRRAVAGDFPLLVSWYQAFGAEVLVGNRGDVEDKVRHRLAAGDLFLWEDDGAPVSMAALSPSAGGVSRIGPVYTPPSRRRRGYAAAVTAHVSNTGLAERCRQVVLFADLANSTSNSVYRSIGYEPVDDFSHIVFAD